jgi:hypothetical protein
VNAIDRGKEGEMDGNEYLTIWLLRERHAAMLAEARRRALAERYGPARGPVRATLGTALIRLGAWLLREPRVSPRTA